MRKEELLAQQEAMDENLRRIEAGRQRERQLKKEVKLLNMQMKQDTVERMKRVEEYKRLETIRMLKEQEDRTNKMMAQKKHILMQRKKAGVDAKLQRDKIQGAMEKVKISKKWHQAGAILNKAMASDKPARRKKKQVASAMSLPAAGSSQLEDALPPVGMSMNQGADDPLPYKSPYDGQQVTV